MRVCRWTRATGAAAPPCRRPRKPTTSTRRGQYVPDLLIELGRQKLLLECKSCTKLPALIKKDEAWAVIQKAADFDAGMRRVTLGKPAFDETSKRKAAAAQDIALVEHGVFMDGLLRVHADNQVNQKLAVRPLLKLGYRVDLGANGHEAVECVERRACDLVLMDVQMPEMDGLEATCRITQRWSAAGRPRIVAMTANAMRVTARPATPPAWTTT